MTFRNFVKSYMEYGTDEEKAWVVVSLIFLKYYNDDETFEKMLDEEIGGNQATSNRCNCDNTIVEKENLVKNYLRNQCPLNIRLIYCDI